MVIANQSHAEIPKLSVTPTSVELGKSCTLTWSSSGQGGYLVGYGLVKASGSLEVTRMVKFVERARIQGFALRMGIYL